MKRVWGEKLRNELDQWFGTFARYIGLGLLVCSVFVDRLKNPALITTAAGLVFLKTVVGGKE